MALLFWFSRSRLRFVTFAEVCVAADCVLSVFHRLRAVWLRWERFRMSRFLSSDPICRLIMCKPSSCRFACIEASAGRLPTTVRPAAEGGHDRHSAGPAVGHVCGEAERHEGGGYRCPQGTVYVCRLLLPLPLSPSFVNERKISTALLCLLMK